MELSKKQHRNLKLRKVTMPKWKYLLYEFSFMSKLKFKNFIASIKKFKYEKSNIYLSITNMNFFQISIGIDDSDFGDINSFCIILPFLYLSLKIKNLFKKRYLINIDRNYISFNIYYDSMGDKSNLNYYYFPWSFEWYQTKHLDKNNNWIIDSKKNRINTWDDNFNNKLFSETYDYRYILKNGNIIKTKATINVRIMEWRRKGIMFSSFGNKVRKTIDVKFEDPIGEYVHSYKGGVTGTGFLMKENESPYDALKRMEKEYKC
jgi:hypothetical protein